MATSNLDAKPTSLGLVGGSTFGVHPIIDCSKTLNMHVSDSALINFSGWEISVAFDNDVEGRGWYVSHKGGFAIIVRGANVFRINDVLEEPIRLFSIGSSIGFASICETNSSQIIIVAGGEQWIYNYSTNTFAQLSIDPNIVPQYVAFQNTQILFGNSDVSINSEYWGAFTTNDTPLTLDEDIILPMTTDVNTCLAPVPIPSHSNNTLIVGQIVGESWAQVGSEQDYQKNQSVNCPYGSVSVETIITSTDTVLFLGQNRWSPIVIITCDGSNTRQIATNGIAYFLERLNRPDKSFATFYGKQTNLFAIFSFYDPLDNVSIMYDFTNDLFYHVSDWDYSFFPGRKILTFKNKTYFLSYKDGNLYRIGSDIPNIVMKNATYQIPRIRRPSTFMLESADPFFVDSISYQIESGLQPLDDSLGDTPPRVDVLVSDNGGYTWGSTFSMPSPATGQITSKPFVTNLGRYNRFTPEFRFWSDNRVVVRDGVINIRGA